jgi:predicted phage-related endonuclease
MSTQINAEMVDLDPAASAFLSAYIEAKAKVKEWTEKADIAAEQVKSALGDAEIGLVNGKEAVRWTSVESRRLDTKKIREMFPAEMVEKLETVSITRRFTIVDED